MIDDVDDGESPANRRRRLLREVAYGRRSYALHQKLYQRFGLLLSCLGILGLSAPLLLALGGEHSHWAIAAAVFFVIVQAIDWRVAPGEKAGLHSARSREFHRLMSASRKLETDELEDRLNVIRDDDLPEIEAVRHLAYIDTANEGGHFDLLTERERHLSGWEKLIRVVLF